MSKSFRELREQSIRSSSNRTSSMSKKNDPKSRHAASHSRTPHVPKPYTTGPSLEENALGRSIVKAVFGKSLGNLIINKAPKNKNKPTKKKTIPEQFNSISEWRTLSPVERKKRILMRRTKAAIKRHRKNIMQAGMRQYYGRRKKRMSEDYAPTTANRASQLRKTAGEIIHQKLYGKHPYFGSKRNQQDRIMGKITARLNKEEAPAVSVAGGAVPTITDPTTNYAAQLKKRMNMLRRKKPV